jgi:glutathione S-transferase
LRVALSGAKYFEWTFDTLMTNEVPTIVGRSSSVFTRVARIFAAELEVEYAFEVVRDLMSADRADYAGNPALRLPNLRTSSGVWFGALGICRELRRRSKLVSRIVWPEDLDQPLLANAQELVLQAMASEVTFIMSRLAGVDPDSAYQAKTLRSLLDSLAWLDAQLPAALAALPVARDVSYLEVTLFCLITHLTFREVLPTSGYANLTRFCEAFGARASARATPYRFDP